MEKFIPKEKLSKKARKALEAKKRATWDISPVTKRVESKKVYNRKKNSRVRYEDEREFFHGHGDYSRFVCASSTICWAMTLS